jgi:AcrR family transcriptional regulator
MRLLERQEIEQLTTNEVAATAGVGIGTLYQYFANKEAILDALADRETAAMSTRVVEAMDDATILSTEARIAAIMGAVTTGYGERRQAHRRVMAHSLTRGASWLSPLLSRLMGHLSQERSSGPIPRPIARADAFVLTHAIAGVLRAMIAGGEVAPSRTEVAQALERLVVRFAG